ncbi:alcohol dehydrogenase catalytic domain-containing protein [Paraburkholderia sp. IMGN_8]|uniref:alcohol dehydrogenase catalytic domain-containing protein n=1 Tax=Paraburkholderia sp. IMGN_8 TaxID=3136564 RepID=UPI0031015D7F
MPRPGRGEVLVRVEATSVNPIDVKRAKGYGRRLLGLKGAGKFPLVLGNDFSGEIVTVLRRADDSSPHQPEPSASRGTRRSRSDSTSRSASILESKPG